MRRYWRRGATCQGGHVLAQRLDVRAQRFQLVGASASAIGRPPGTDTLCSTPHHLQIPLVVRHCIAFTQVHGMATIDGMQPRLRLQPWHCRLSHHLLMATACACDVPCRAGLEARMPSTDSYCTLALHIHCRPTDTILFTSHMYATGMSSRAAAATAYSSVGRGQASAP